MESLSNNTAQNETEHHRQTIQRDAIFQYLQESTSHPTADDIYRELKKKYPSLSLATIYNTLQYLIGEGKISVLGDLGDRRVHFDKSVEPHLNMVCESCKQVFDLPNDDFRKSVEQIENQSGFKVKSSRVIFFGLCPECQKPIENKEK